MCPAMQYNLKLGFTQGPLPEDEMLWKLDLADFFLAAHDLDYAGALYSETLYRSCRSSDWDLLHLSVRLLRSSFHSSQYRTVKKHLAFLLLIKNKVPLHAGNSLWIMHLLRGLICNARGDLHLANQHITGASRLLEQEVSNWTGQFDPFFSTRQFFHTHSALIARVNSSLKTKNLEMNKGLSTSRWSLDSNGIALFPKDSMQVLLKWCLKQVGSSGYGAMLGSASQKPWTKAPDLISLQRFESTSLFCYLWHKYRHEVEAEPRESPSLRATVLLAMEQLQNSLRLSAPMIFSSVCWMRADEETAAVPAGYEDVTLEQIAARAVVHLFRLARLDSWRSDWDHYDDESGADRFFKAYASVSRDNEAANDQTHFRKSMQAFVRGFAKAYFPLSSSNVSTGDIESPRNVYAWDTAAFTIKEDKADDDKADKEKADEEKASIQVESTSATPLAVPQSGTLSADPAINIRPASSASVDMLLTPRSSFTSSKASIRSLRRLGRVADLLLKSKGSEVDQLPSESMSIRSQSSWSLRRLTGVSYLTATSDMALDEVEEDTIMVS